MCDVSHICLRRRPSASRILILVSGSAAFVVLGGRAAARARAAPRPPQRRGCRGAPRSKMQERDVRPPDRARGGSHASELAGGRSERAEPAGRAGHRATRLPTGERPLPRRLM